MSDLVLGANGASANTATATTQLDTTTGSLSGDPALLVRQLSAHQNAVEGVGGPSNDKFLAGAGVRGSGGANSFTGPIDPSGVPTGGYGVIGQGGTAEDGAGGMGVWGIGGAGRFLNGGIGVIGWGGGAAGAQGIGVAGATNSNGDIRAGVGGVNHGGGPGVRGTANGGGKGVLGQSGATGAGNGIGVFGQVGGGRGVQGAASGAAGIGVVAENTAGGLGLAVKGLAGFSACGDGTIAAGQATRSVNEAAVTASSHITVTLTGNPGRAQVLWVERQAGVGFVVHLTRAVGNATPFTYLVVEPLTT